jgi:hypothetical protein
MKKILTILVVVGLALFMLGCTQDQPDNNTPKDMDQNQISAADTTEIDATLNEMENDLDELDALIADSEIDIEESELDETII